MHCLVILYPVETIALLPPRSQWVRCWFCDVSFNINRARCSADEEDVPWLRTNKQYFGGCSNEDGCRFIPGSFNRRGERQYLTDPGDDDNGNAYIYESDSDDPYEYESDDDLVDRVSITQLDDDLQLLQHSESNTLFKSWAEETLKIRQVASKEYMLPTEIEGLDEDDNFFWYTTEHFAGLNCKDQRQYNGHHISLEEMRGCTSYQALIRKPRNWKAVDDDEQFELESKYFLSGLGQDMPSMDVDLPSVYPARHGKKTFETTDHLYGVSNQASAALVFHPTCFEVYKHYSRRTWNTVEVDRLMKFYRTSSFETENDEAVLKCLGQWWQHCPGTEWLAANPVHVPLLPKIFQDAISIEDLDPNSGVFPPRTIDRASSTSFDPFQILPTELVHMILSNVSSKDIANLRLVSRRFEQLPMSLWHGLLCKEMPWLWEVWTDEKPSFWASTTEVDLVERQNEKLLFEAELERYRKVIKEEAPAMFDAWKAAEPTFDEYKPLQHLSPSILGMLPRNKTNWYKLYRDIKGNWQDLKGLRNRQRIWKDIGALVQSIQQQMDNEFPSKQVC